MKQQLELPLDYTPTLEKLWKNLLSHSLSDFDLNYMNQGNGFIPELIITTTNTNFLYKLIEVLLFLRQNPKL